MIFQRAALREFAHAAAAVFVALFAILISVVLIRLLGQAAGGRLPADAVLALIGFGALAQLPVVLSLTLFIAVLSVLSRTYRDSEMVIWFASGLPLTAWIWPVLRFALPMVAVIAACTLTLSPWAQYKNIEYRERVSNQQDASRVAPGVFREASGAQRVFFVEGGEGSEQGAQRVARVFVSAQNGQRLDVTVAAEGHLRTEPNGDRFVVLENGRRYDGIPGQRDFRVLEFERYAVRLDTPAAAPVPIRARGLSLPALLDNWGPAARGELLYRVGMPTMAVLLALLAIPLSFVNPRAGRSSNLLVALLIYLIYSNSISIAQSWVTHGKLDFWLAVWLPHLLMIALLAALFYKRLRMHAVWRWRP